MRKAGTRIGAPAVLALAVCLFFASTAQAQVGQSFEDFGVGPRDSAMGNTGTAAANDFSAAFYNPAALVRAREFALQMGYKGIYPRLRLKIGRYHERYFTRYPSTNFFLMGFSWNVVAERLIDRKWTERLSVGMAFAISDYYKSFSIYYDPDTPYFYRYHDRYLNLLPMYFSAGVRITDWLSVGAGMVPAPSDTYTSVTVDSHFTLPKYKMWADQGVLTRSYGKLEPVAGILLRIPDDEQADFCSLGFVWRDEVSSIDGEGHAYNTTHFNFDGLALSGPPVPTEIRTLSGWSPMQVVSAIALRPSRTSTITGELLWKRWSEWRTFFNRHPTPRFEDTWNGRFGAEKIFELGNAVLASMGVRGGVYREVSPVPDQNGQSNFLDPDKWVLTAGVDASWIDHFDIFRAPFHTALSGQWHRMDRLRLHNGQDPDYPELEAWGDLFSITATVGIGFQ